MTSWPIHRVCWSGSGGGALPVFVCSGALQLGVDSLRRVYDRNMSPGTLGPVAEHEGQRVRGDAGNAGDKQDYHGVRQSELDRILPWSLASVWPPRRAWTATPSGRIGNLGGGYGGLVLRCFRACLKKHEKARTLDAGRGRWTGAWLA